MRVITVLVGCASLAACGLETITVPANIEKPRAIIHLVLDPGKGVHLAVLTATRANALPFIPGQQIDIDSLVGPPIIGARMVIIHENGDSAVAKEDSSGGTGRGRYRFFNSAFAGGTQAQQIAVEMGKRYTLRIETTLGTITGATRVPVVTNAMTQLVFPYNVERDTLVTSAAVSGAAGFMVSSDDASFDFQSVEVIPAMHRYLWIPERSGGGRERTTFDYVGGVAFPGRQQRLGVAALDSNAVKFYLAGFDPFGDDTKGNTVRGGVGLFGASVTLYDATVETVGTINRPIEGTWVTSSTSDSIPTRLELYDVSFVLPAPPGPNSSVAFTGSTYFRDGVRGTTSGTVNPDSTVRLVASGRDRSIELRGNVRNGVLTLARTNSTSAIVYRRP